MATKIKSAVFTRLNAAAFIKFWRFRCGVYLKQRATKYGHFELRNKDGVDYRVDLIGQLTCHVIGCKNRKRY